MNTSKMGLFIGFLVLSLSAYGRLPTDSEIAGRGNNGAREATASLIDRCVQGIIASRPEYASQAFSICSRVYSQTESPSQTREQFAGRNMADCLSLMRTFSVPRDVASSLCQQIVASSVSPSQDAPILSEDRADRDATDVAL